jgi:peptidyl-tRNA hydrolase, PTH2 family
MEQDPIRMYFVVNTDLNMSAGKLSAQVAHGTQMCMIEYTVYVMREALGSSSNNIEENNFLLFRQWLSSDYGKVVLAANAKEFSKCKELQEKHYLVVDNGLTQFNNVKTETVIAFMPMYKSKAPKIIKHLQLLK